MTLKLCLITIFLKAVFTTVDAKRPFYIIGHMVNDKYQIKTFLNAGANAIEADVQFNSTGTALQFYHGLPCDCWRFCHSNHDIADYLTYVKRITTRNSGYEYRPDFTLLLFDLKTYQIDENYLKDAGKMFATLLHENLFVLESQQTSSLRVLLGVEKTSHKDFILGFLEETKTSNLDFDNRLGWQISENENYETIYSMWEEIKEVKNIWYSDGITNCLIGYRDKTRAKTLFFKRTARIFRTAYHPKKIYLWTVDKENAIMGYWRAADGVITNKPQTINEIVHRKYGSSLKIATIEDNPWEKYNVDYSLS